MDIPYLIKKFKNLVDSVTIEAENIDYSILGHHVNLLERIAVIENSSMTIFDMFQKKYVFIRSNFKDVLGYDEIRAAEDGSSYFFKRMHPKDVPLVIDTSAKGLEFINSLPPENRQDYKTVFEHRLMDSTGQYIRFLQQETVLELDLIGNVWLILILTDVCPNQLETKVFQRSLINVKTGKTTLFSNDDIGSDAGLSPREVEIIGLLGKGFFSKEIADRLFISVNTVNNHRQNIIRKMGVSNTSEAFSYARKIGIV
jgi:DNA-binding CsgD family transcriptional regulator